MSDDVYDPARARRLERDLADVARRILELSARGDLLAQAGELLQRFGDLRSELFRYEVRVTYDTPEIAESRRIVRDAAEPAEGSGDWANKPWTPNGEEESTW